MKKKYHKRLEIRNQLYRRFTNRGKGFTPRGFYSPYLGTLRSRNRIYKIVEDINFNTYSYKNPSDLFVLSSSLPAENVALVKIEQDNYIYSFVFRNASSMKRSPVKEEHSSILYPGVYFVNKCWVYVYYSNIYNSGLTRVIPPTFSCYNYQGSFSVGSYAIYIPFDSIKTPILQAYLPLFTVPSFIMSMPDYTNRIVDGESVSFPLGMDVRESCYWMGCDVLKHPKTAKTNHYPNEFKYGYRARNYDQIDYLHNLAYAFLMHGTHPYSSNVGLCLYNLPPNNSAIYNDTEFKYRQASTTFGERVSYLQDEYLSNNYTDSTVYLYLSGTIVGSSSTRMVYLGEYTYGKYVGRESVSPFSKELKKAIRSLAIPVGEFFDSSSIIKFE